MALWRSITVGALAVIAIPAAVRELFHRNMPAGSPGLSPKTSIPQSRTRLIISTAAVTAAAGAVLMTVGGLLVMASGVYQIAADEPHRGPVRWVLETGRTRSVKFHSRDVSAPSLYEPALTEQGLRLYLIHCQVCHGGPGVPARQSGRGINPTPPPLATRVHDWTDRQLYWIVAHGLKMSGMPSFGVKLNETERWAVVSFLRWLPLMPPADYQRFAAAGDAGVTTGALRAIQDADPGFVQLRSRADAQRGLRLFRQYGCWTCHNVSRAPRAFPGPPLVRYAERAYIAGNLVNVPSNLAVWIQNPRRIEPNTAMPNLVVADTEALDIAAYLYTLGSSRRMDVLERTTHR